MKWKKIWRFIWKDDSWLSWCVNVVLAIVIVKFIIFPVLGLSLGTSFPVVAVVSCSMQHENSNCWADCYMRSSGGIDDMKFCNAKPKTLCGNLSQGDYWNICGEWYEKIGIDQNIFLEFPQKNGFNIGDIFVLKRATDIKIGDIIVYDNLISNAPIIHRVVKIIEDDGKNYYQTKGDYNPASYAFEEKIPQERVYGKVLLKLPYLGWVKIGFNMILKMVGIL